MGSIGTRLTADQLVPFELLEKTMSFELHFARKRQSSHATYTFPAPSISALGSGLVRRPPPTVWNAMFAMVTACDQLAPPSVERNAASLPVVVSNGTITVPFGRTTGCPPRPWGLPCGETGWLHVTPRGPQGLMYSRALSPACADS